ncbi:MAG TPA: hypothetical protein VJX29_08375 [Candidatus Acidoferrales bacterium]|nr:hypothetical protein [Candidatus Acidoferrales bacterium]
MRILVADDDVVLTRLLEQRLHDRGFGVQIAHDPRLGDAAQFVSSAESELIQLCPALSDFRREVVP